MKLKFSIPYKAEWGESLHVDLTYFSRDGHRQNDDLVMTTSDGYIWNVDTQARTNRHHPYSAIAYYYKVVDSEGRVKRRESVVSPRAYVYNAEKNYLFMDFWLEEKKDSFATSGKTKDMMSSGKFAKHAASSGKFVHKVAPVDWSEAAVALLPLFLQTVIFRVNAPRLHEGEAVALLGNHPALGDWNTDRYLPMQQTANGDWVLSVNVQALEAPLEYKYVVVDAQMHQFKRWEVGENRTMGQLRLYAQDVCVLHGGDFRVKPLPPHAQFDFETYIFDLDGTLLSTLDDLAASCNYALRHNGMPERTLDEVRRFVGNGVKKLMERAIPDGLENEKFEKVFADFRQHYMIHNLDTTKPYPGVMEMLEELKARGKNVAVVSNKFYAATQSLCRHFFGDLVDVAIGEREDIRKKPAPDTVNEVLRLLHADRKKAVYIGDSDVDVMTAENSGMPCISVLWGFRDHDFLAEHGATIYVSSAEQLL